MLRVPQLVYLIKRILSRFPQIEIKNSNLYRCFQVFIIFSLFQIQQILCQIIHSTLIPISLIQNLHLQIYTDISVQKNQNIHNTAFVVNILPRQDWIQDFQRHDLFQLNPKQCRYQIFQCFLIFLKHSCKQIRIHKTISDFSMLLHQLFRQFYFLLQALFPYNVLSQLLHSVFIHHPPIDFRLHQPCNILCVPIL